jgi:hypothetical protein
MPKQLKSSGQLEDASALLHPVAFGDIRASAEVGTVPMPESAYA